MTPGIAKFKHFPRPWSVEFDTAEQRWIVIDARGSFIAKTNIRPKADLIASAANSHFPTLAYGALVGIIAVVTAQIILAIFEAVK